MAKLALRVRPYDVVIDGSHEPLPAQLRMREAAQRRDEHGQVEGVRHHLVRKR